MDYKLVKAENKDLPLLMEYKLATVLEYNDSLDDEELYKIKNYITENTKKYLDEYKLIMNAYKIIGVVLYYEKDDGVFLDEIYIIDSYRNKGIATDLLKNMMVLHPVLYLWVFKDNVAVKLYKKLGFEIISEDKRRYYMRNMVNL